MKRDNFAKNKTKQNKTKQQQQQQKLYRMSIISEELRDELGVLNFATTAAGDAPTSRVELNLRCRLGKSVDAVCQLFVPSAGELCCVCCFSLVVRVVLCVYMK